MLGPKWLLDRGLTRPDAVIAAGFAYSVATAHNGCLHLEVTVTGKQAHAAMPETGVDALEAATAILSGLYAQRAELSRRRSNIPGIVSPTLNVGLISGGINTNVVPDQVIFRIDRRMIPEETPADVEAELRALIAASRTRPSESQGRRASTPAGGPPDPAVRHRPHRGGNQAPCRAHSRRRCPAERCSTLYRRPPLCGGRHPDGALRAGPRSILEANAHDADENLRLADLRAATTIVALAVAELLNSLKR